MESQEAQIVRLRKQLYDVQVKNDSLQRKLKAALAEVKRLTNYFQNNFNHLEETGTSTPEPPTS